MKLTAPTKVWFWVAVALAAVGLLAVLITIPFLSSIAFWILLVGFIILMLANLLKGM
ncbi:MAG: hypothetical protein JSV54_07270 [Chloroflexota bacterium]|nr:MAG: hypothetical protein JSV54_07270 [Chloroflexota bacterium]